MRDLYRVVEEHKASFDYAFVAERGEVVTVGKEDDASPGWYWCRNRSGMEAWVPETHISIEGSKGVLNQPYNSIEHDVKPGEVVQYLGASLGWIECLNKEWKYGWIPRDKMEKIQV